MALEAISISTTSNKAFLISGYVSSDVNIITFPGAPQVDVTDLTDSVNADFLVSYKGAISPPKNDSISYTADVAGQYLMMIGALQPRLSSVGSTVKVFG